MNGGTNVPLPQAQPVDKNFQQQGYTQYQQFQGQQQQQMYQQIQPGQQQQQFFDPQPGQQPQQLGQQQPSQQPQFDTVLVKTLIEQYLQYYYNYQQIIYELEKKGISQDVTTYVLQILIAQNREYFIAYEIRVTLNDQIDRFNKFIRRHFQVAAQQVMQQPPGAALHAPLNNQGSQMSQSIPPQPIQQQQNIVPQQSQPIQQSAQMPQTLPQQAQQQQNPPMSFTNDMSGDYANSFISSFQGDQSLGM
ncbi:alpha/beta-gliadin A-V precursor, putative [Entamoeba invadens IP1]|uniref:Alpha/beta-gliadin A-V, putative n=1 Tax=Entamoeba invadens IP1 TaxID=370355 RepID=A0A0A1U8M2_ENTIV|nr:alpha/beta-gliadin A-V precursor, putative [Entamoeba invadens IP1]ELP89428.1 alpha/beta-gliadin A-V precursor, putative [Entamoeba invadens IP1]|eukprot:XP_004256199.1 alpha/beta-gliadin A-V precursor, putative [Entamoeba invadens IP1]